MTRFGRMESRLPELIDELASPRVPDYFDDMLQQVRLARQRPAWSSPERWLPMAETVRVLTNQWRLPWRLIAVVAMLALVAAATLVYVGSQPRPLPSPFGPAGNGMIAFGTADGRIVGVDPDTLLVSTIIDATTDSNPWFSNDGSKFVFERGIDGSGRSLFIANADGSEVREVLGPAGQIDWLDWSPDGTRLVISRWDDPRGAITIVDAGDGTATTLQVDLKVFGVIWRPGTDQLIVTGETDSPSGVERGFYLIGADGGGLRPIVASTSIVNEPAVSADGSKLAYTIWAAGLEGRTHVVDIETGIDHGVDFGPGEAYNDLSPVFSPDGSKLMLERYTVAGYRLTIVPIDGRGPVVAMGEARPAFSGGAAAVFSPDGSKVLATYRNDKTTWLLDTATGAATRLDLQIASDSIGTWQRIAP